MLSKILSDKISPNIQRLYISLNLSFFSIINYNNIDIIEEINGPARIRTGVLTYLNVNPRKSEILTTRLRAE